MNEQNTLVPKAKEEIILQNADYSLSPAELKRAEAVAEQIDICDIGEVLQYGAEAQQKMAEFSAAALENVRNKDLGEVGNIITALAGQLKGDMNSSGGVFTRLLKKGGSKAEALKSKYAKAEKTVEKITEMLEDRQMELMKDIALLEEMYRCNEENYRELTVYIAAGKRKLCQVRTEIIPELSRRATESSLPSNAQKLRDMEMLCDRFEKRIYDLELTRAVAFQMSPQIRLVQNNDTLMAEKIKSTLNNTVPLWKSQTVIALGLHHSLEATKMQRQIADMTNALLLKNAENLKTATLETVRESSRGIIDIETLKETNKMLLETLDGIRAVQKENADFRRAAELELMKIEREIKDLP